MVKKWFSICMLCFVLCMHTPNFCADQQPISPEEAFAKIVSKGNYDEIMAVLYTDKPLNWVNNKVMWNGKMVIPLQVAIERIQKLEKELDTKNPDYENRLQNLKMMKKFIILPMVNRGHVDLELLTKDEQNLPYIKEYVEKQRLKKLTKSMRELSEEKSINKYDQKIKEITKKVDAYLSSIEPISATNISNLVNEIIEYDLLPLLEFVFKKTKINPKEYADANFAIEKAISNLAEKSLSFFIKNKANIKNEQGQLTPLQRAAEQLLNNKSYHSMGDEWEQNSPDRAPLKLRIIKDLNIIKMLLDAGADTTGIEEYVTPGSKKYDKDIATYYNAYLDELKRYRGEK